MNLIDMYQPWHIMFLILAFVLYSDWSKRRSTDNSKNGTQHKPSKTISKDELDRRLEEARKPPGPRSDTVFNCVSMLLTLAAAIGIIVLGAYFLTKMYLWIN